MSDIRKRIDQKFANFAQFVCRYKWATFIVMFLIIMGLMSQLDKLVVDTSTESYFRDNDPALMQLQSFRDQFGEDSVLVVGINPPDVFDIEFLKKLKAFHLELEDEVPFLDEVRSLVTVDHIQGRKGELLVEELLNELPTNQEELAALRAFVLSNQNYRNTYISEDGKFTTVLVRSDAFADDELIEGQNSDSEQTAKKRQKRVLGGEDNATFVNAVRAIAEKYETEDFPIYVSGYPVFIHHTSVMLGEDTDLVMKIGFAVIAVFLLLVFRRVSGIILPQLVVFCVMFSTFGLMAITGVPMTSTSQVLPVFLLVMGIGASVHLMSMFFQFYDKTGDKEHSVVEAMKHSGLPILLTSLTTAVGLISFSGAELLTVAQLGVFAAIGVMLAFVYTVTVIPALIAIFPIRKRKTVRETPKLVSQVLTGMGDAAVAKPWWIIGAAAIIAAVGIWGATKTNFSHDPVRWFPEDDKVRIATELVDKELKGSMTMEILVDTGEKGKLYEPEIMSKLAEVNQFAENLQQGEVFIGKSTSIVDVVEEINYAMNESKPEAYSVPDDRSTIAQELLLFDNSGSTTTEMLVDINYSKARITLKLPWIDAISYASVIRNLEETTRIMFDGLAETEVTGMLALLTQTFDKMINTMKNSYLIAGIAITVMMILLIGNLKLGLLSMIPNFLPIIMAFGFMGIMGMPIDAASILMGSVVLGLAVDDTVHFMYNYNRYFKESGVCSKAVHNTLMTTGQAILFTTIILCAGFTVNATVSSMQNVANTGIVFIFAFITAFLADLLLMPAILEVTTRVKIGSKSNAEALSS